jgi:predicted RNase H-like HicB family nuclease
LILTLPVSVHEEDDGYVAVCPVFSVIGKGKTLTDALNNVKESLQLFLDDETIQLKFHDEIHNYSFPEFEFIEVVVHEKPGIHQK